MLTPLLILYLMGCIAALITASTVGAKEYNKENPLQQIKPIDCMLSWNYIWRIKVVILGSWVSVYVLKYID